MSDETPKHGEVVTVRIPASTRRRRWCALCHIWTWEIGIFGSGIWRHARRGRSAACKRQP